MIDPNHVLRVGAATDLYVEQLTARIAELEKENARLRTVPMKYRRMAFNAQLQDENNELRNQLAKAEQRVAEACSAYMLNKNYNSLEFDRKYSAKEFCAGQKSTVEFLAKMIRSGEWRKFVKEV